MRGGIVYHTIMNPAALSLPLLRVLVVVHRQYFKMTGFVPESPIFWSVRLVIEKIGDSKKLEIPQNHGKRR